MRLLTAGLCLASAVAFADAGGNARSFANIDQFRVTHVDLNLDLDFGARQLSGSATLKIRRLDPSATQLVLDTRDLNVTDVDELTHDFLGATEKIAPIWVSRPFRVGRPDPAAGSALIIDLPPSNAATETLRIQYATSPRAAALHWSSQRHWGGGLTPFFYTLSQPTGARSWIPLQDTPLVRATLRAHVHTREELAALMGVADEPKKALRASDHWFVIARPIPAYQIDLAVGDLKFRPFGTRAGVYAYGGIIRAAAGQFGEAQAMLDALQNVTGAIAQPRVDIVVMPVNFPFDTVPIPGLIYLSPALIGGDRRCLSSLARGLAVAAGADPVAPASRRDRWIGRAFAGYLRSRIIEAVCGERQASLQDAWAVVSLRAALAQTGAPDQVLAGGAAEPTDDGRGEIAYQKGALFLDFLDSKFGRARFDGFMRAFFAQFAGHRITTDQFLRYLQTNLLDENSGAVPRAEVDAWVFDPGLPKDAVLPRAESFGEIDRRRSAWLQGRMTADGLGGHAWVRTEWLYFLAGIPPGTDPKRLAELDQTYDLTRSHDAVLEAPWLRLAIRENYEPAYPRLERYLQAGGPTALLEPLYAALLQTPAGTARAARVYSAARPGYDPAAQRSLDALLKR